MKGVLGFLLNLIFLTLIVKFVKFYSGSEQGHIDTFMYSAGEEDFVRYDASKLDTWVFDHVEDFFKDAQKDPILEGRLKEDRIIFFLHLLGLDTNGHAHKPHSK